jgi:hypothetical protein
MINSEASPDSAVDRILLPGAADDEEGVSGLVKSVGGADCPGESLFPEIQGAGLRATLSQYLVTIMVEVARTLRR